MARRIWPRSGLSKKRRRRCCDEWIHTGRIVPEVRSADLLPDDVAWDHAAASAEGPTREEWEIIRSKLLHLDAEGYADDVLAIVAKYRGGGAMRLCECGHDVE